MDDLRYMNRALELAELGKGYTSPNPMVGCVIVYKDRIIGEGWHEAYGNAHAEVNAIQRVEDKSLLSESTVYVTLEPCSHHGKTPPCSDLLIQHHIKRVVIALSDPFEKVNGKGINQLREAGIEVEVGILQERAKELNIRFLTSIKQRRPYVILKWAQTADGFIARSNNDSKWISNTLSRQLVHKWRTEEDGILVGKNTAIHDNPSLTAREWAGKNPVRILLDSQLEAKGSLNLFNDDAETLILNDIKNDQIGSNKWFKVNTKDPKSILSILHEEGIQSIIIEGGAQVLNSFIGADCWDEARIFSSQTTFGEGIEGPTIKGAIINVESIGKDQLTIIKQYNG